MKNTIHQILMEKFEPTALEVIDEGHLHKGHANDGAGHFALVIVSAKFGNLSRMERHRAVYAALNTQIGSGIHALSIKALAPDEWAG